MIVSRSQFDSVLTQLALSTKLACDTEGTGLKPYQGDRLFSIIISDKTKNHYFNFLPYLSMNWEHVLLPEHLEKMKKLFANPLIKWDFANAKYDMAILAQEGIRVVGEIHDVLVGSRVEHNAHFTNSLSDCLERIGLKKDDGPKNFLKENKYVRKVKVSYKKTEEEVYPFYLVPPEIIIPYGEDDARGTYQLGDHQDDYIEDQSMGEEKRSLSKVFEVEKRLTHTVFRIEETGLKIKKEYAFEGAAYELRRSRKALEDYERLTSQEPVFSSQRLSKVFESEKEKWQYTKKREPLVQIKVHKIL